MQLLTHIMPPKRRERERIRDDETNRKQNRHQIPLKNKKTKQWRTDAREGEIEKERRQRNTIFQNKNTN